MIFLCAGKIESIKGALPIGVGLFDALVNLNEIITKNSVKEMVFIGSAGSYGRDNIFDIVESCMASQVEYPYLNDDSYTPLQNILLENVSCETKMVVNSSNYITSSKKISDKFLHNGYDLENMEFYSVMFLAKRYGIKAKGIFVVTNYCDENAHKDFIANQKKANEIMESIIEQYR